MPKIAETVLIGCVKAVCSKHELLKELFVGSATEWPCLALHGWAISPPLHERAEKTVRQKKHGHDWAWL